MVSQMTTQTRADAHFHRLKRLLAQRLDERALRIADHSLRRRLGFKIPVGRLLSAANPNGRSWPRAEWCT